MSTKAAGPMVVKRQWVPLYLLGCCIGAGIGELALAYLHARACLPWLSDFAAGVMTFIVGAGCWHLHQVNGVLARQHDLIVCQQALICELLSERNG